MSIKKTLLCLRICLMAICLTAAVSSGGVVTAKAAASGQERVFDEAGLFTEQEKAELELRLAAAIAEVEMDLAVLTIDDTAGKTSEQYADDYYEESGLGFGTDYSGALCLIDMDNRQLYISTEGKMRLILTDTRIQSIMDNAIGYVGDGAYVQSVDRMLEDIKDDVAAGIVEDQHLYDRDTGAVVVYHKRSVTWYEALFALVVSGSVALLPCVSTIKQYRMESERKQALNYHLAYRSSNAFAVSVTNDLFLNKMVSQRRINQNHNHPGSGGSGGMSSAGRSTVHRSSSGRSHGGGGRGF